MLDTWRAQTAFVRFTGCLFLGAGWFHFAGGPVTLDNCTIVRVPWARWRRKLEPDMPQRLALAATGSGILAGSDGRTEAGPETALQYRPYAIATGAQQRSVRVGQGFALETAKNALPIHARSLQMPGAERMPLPGLSGTLAPNGLSDVAIDGATVGFTLAAASLRRLPAGAPDMGDLIIDPGSGVVLLVNRRQGRRINTTVQTGLTGSRWNAPTLVADFPASARSLIVVIGRAYLLSRWTTGRCIEGHQEMIQVADADGGAEHLAEIGAGDDLVCPPDPSAAFGGSVRVEAVSVEAAGLILSRPARRTGEVPVIVFVRRFAEAD